jgi:chloramphenicol 3-O phosphotransferase
MKGLNFMFDSKYFLMACIVFTVLFVAYFYKQNNTQKSYGTVIILNGPSASGKSSIQKAFQPMMMPDLWIKHGIDSLFDGSLPDITLDNLAYWQSKNSIRWVETTKDKDQNNVITLFVGEQGDKVAYGMNSAIAAYAQNGNNIIVDYIAYKKEWIDDLRQKLKDIKTYFVKVNIPLEILEQREKIRDTSPSGHARSHYDIVHCDIKYDLDVESSKQKPEEIAQQIKEFITKKN